MNLRREEKGTGTLETPVGVLYIEAGACGITRVTLADAAQPCAERETPLIAQAKRELTEYFAGKRTAFTLPLEEKGTPFERAVWAALRTVPYGQTRTYGQIAAQIGSPRAARAVGMANHKNPLPIVTPCHRIVGANGALTGYALGLNRKQMLLEMERDVLKKR